MQLLLSAAAYERVRTRVAPHASQLEVVTIRAPGEFVRCGDVVPADVVDPEVVWTSIDAAANGLVPAMHERLLRRAGPSWLQTFAAGIEAPVYRRLMAKGIRITKNSGQAVAIAEYVVAHVLSLIVPLEAQRDLQARREWTRTPYREVGDTRWVILGAGAVSRAIAARIKPFGAHLTVVRRGTDPMADADRTVGTPQLAAVIAEADVVVLACALNDDTRELADDRFFAALRPGAILVNVARGELIDEDALRRGLAAGRPGRAVLDVARTEPLAADHWLWDHPNVRVSAHTSFAGSGTVGRSDELFVANLERFLSGRPLMHEASAAEVGLP